MSQLINTPRPLEHKSIFRTVLFNGLVAFFAGSVIAINVSMVVHAAACQLPANNYGTDTLSISVPNTISYTIWVRIQAPSETDNTILLQINGTTCFNVGGGSTMPLNSLTWVNYQNGVSSQPMQIQLSAGSSSLELIGNAPGVAVDSILALGDPNCVPTGLGTNCTIDQPAPTKPPPGGTSTSPSGTSGGSGSGVASSKTSTATLPKVALSASGTTLSPNNSQTTLTNPVTVQPTYTQGLTIKKVRYYLNKKLVYVATRSPFTYYLNTNKLSNGRYTLLSDTTYTSGQSVEVSQVIVVKHSFFKNLGIIFRNNLVTILILLFIAILVSWLVIKYDLYLKRWANRFLGWYRTRILRHVDSPAYPPPVDTEVIKPSNDSPPPIDNDPRVK